MACSECEDHEVAVVGCTASTDRVCVPSPDVLPGLQPNIVTNEGDVLLTPGTKLDGRTGVLFSAGDVVVNGKPLSGSMAERGRWLDSLEDVVEDLVMRVEQLEALLNVQDSEDEVPIADRINDAING